MRNDSDCVVFENVSKSYVVKGFLKNKIIRAVKDISFSIKKGEIVGIFGLNGAGKTTIIKLIAGLTKPDSGRVMLFGSYLDYTSVEYKKRIGYLPELPYFHPFLKVINVLELYYSLCVDKIEQKNIMETLKLVGLYEKRNEKIKNLSKGMLQRLSIASSIIHNPDLLLYDEPASGLDPIAIKDIRDLIIDFKKKGKTIIISSHSISEAEKVCDRVFILSGGKISRIIEKKEWENGDLEKMFIEAVKYEA